MDLLFTCQHGNRGLVNQTGPRVKLLKEQAVLQVSLVFKTVIAKCIVLLYFLSSKFMGLAIEQLHG